MHIAHVTSFYASPPVEPSSAVRSRGLAYRAAGHEFTVIVPGVESTVTWAEYGTVITVPARGRALARGFVPVAKAIRRALEKLIPDQLEVADRLSARELGSWALRNRVPAIQLIDTPASLTTPHRAAEGYARIVAVYPQSETTFAPSATNVRGEEAEPRPDAPVAVTGPVLLAPAGVNLEVFSPLRHNTELRDSSDAGLVILCAVPLTAAGQPALAIDLVQRRVAAGEDIHLVILGDGPLLERLKRRSADLPVQFLSARDLDLAERAEVFATADISLVTVGGSDAHAVALESLASGTPVVVTTACTPSLRFISGGGLSVEPDLAHIEHAIRVLAEEPVENRRRAARSTALPYDSLGSERDLLALHESLHANVE